MPWVIDKRVELVGTRWRRRQPLDQDDGWNDVEIVGVFQVRDSEFEPVIAPCGAFGTPESCDPEAFVAAYGRSQYVREFDATRELQARLEQVGAGL